jgi:hypothetical protein
MRSEKSKDNHVKPVKKFYHHLKPKVRHPLGHMKTDDNDMSRGYYIKNTSKMYSRNQLELDHETAGYAGMFRGDSKLNHGKFK